MIRRLVSDADHIFLACGATDFRRQARGLAEMVRQQFRLDSYSGNYVFIFCNKKRDGSKVWRYDSNRFLLVSKKLLDGMRFQWPRTPEEVKEISFRQAEWLLRG